ncbi:TRAP transporter substrate-binding protein DctP [Salinibacterium sp. ZJ450]|uniref:TRAP transporter substrate-binding protein DctP n=1 Tax=Salinibacterium sp. ZJ450 TaxID=2708338 RepID=UPI0014212A4B|nr:TRAP transporter substrate-binding protein DctP [Salinibacterium sp. ZJ450]
MKYSKKGFLALGAMSALALLAGCAGAQGAGPAQTAEPGDGFDWSAVEPVELTASSVFPLGNTSQVMETEWMAAITEATEGKVTFDYYGGGVLHPVTEAISALNSGLTDVTFVNNGYFADQLPVSNWDDAVMQTAVSDFGYPNMNIAGIGQQVVHHSSPDSAARAEMTAAGFIPILPMLSGPQGLHCSEPFQSPADLKGRTVRIPYPIAQEELESLGMTGMFLPPNEVYEALQRGVIDCALNATTNILAGGLLEVSPWVAFPNTAPSPGANIAISTSAWDELIPEIQQVMLDTRHEPFERFARDTLDGYAEIVVAAEDAGGGIIDAAELNPAIAQYWAGRPSLGKTAPDGVTDPEAEIARTNAIAEAWWDFTVDELGVPADSDDTVEVLSLGADVIDGATWKAWTEAIVNSLGAE